MNLFAIQNSKSPHNGALVMVLLIALSAFSSCGQRQHEIQLAEIKLEKGQTQPRTVEVNVPLAAMNVHLNLVTTSELSTHAIDNSHVAVRATWKNEGSGNLSVNPALYDNSGGGPHALRPGESFLFYNGTLIGLMGAEPTRLIGYGSEPGLTMSLDFVPEVAIPEDIVIELRTFHPNHPL
jgi:hypothetical protein